MTLDELQREYIKRFDDIFPVTLFLDKTIGDVTAMIKRCIAHNKDVYDMGYAKF